MGRWLTRKEDPGNKLKTTPPKIRRLAKTPSSFLPRRATSLWTRGARLSPATQDSVILPLSLHGLRSQGITSRSPHTTRFTRAAIPRWSHWRCWRRMQWSHSSTSHLSFGQMKDLLVQRINLTHESQDSDTNGIFLWQPAASRTYTDRTVASFWRMQYDKCQVFCAFFCFSHSNSVFSWEYLQTELSFECARSVITTS